MLPGYLLEASMQRTCLQWLWRWWWWCWWWCWWWWWRRRWRWWMAMAVVDDYQRSQGLDDLDWVAQGEGMASLVSRGGDWPFEWILCFRYFQNPRIPESILVLYLYCTCTYKQTIMLMMMWGKQMRRCALLRIHKLIQGLWLSIAANRMHLHASTCNYMRGNGADVARTLISTVLLLGISDSVWKLVVDVDVCCCPCFLYCIVLSLCRLLMFHQEWQIGWVDQTWQFDQDPRLCRPCRYRLSSETLICGSLGNSKKYNVSGSHQFPRWKKCKRAGCGGRDWLGSLIRKSNVNNTGKKKEKNTNTVLILIMILILILILILIIIIIIIINTIRYFSCKLRRY